MSILGRSSDDDVIMVVPVGRWWLQGRNVHMRKLLVKYFLGQDSADQALFSHVDDAVRSMMRSDGTLTFGREQTGSS